MFSYSVIQFLSSLVTQFSDIELDNEEGLHSPSSKFRLGYLGNVFFGVTEVKIYMRFGSLKLMKENFFY
jgi:hypothetical protein